jgi:hypothetical protein
MHIGILPYKGTDTAKHTVHTKLFSGMSENEQLLIVTLDDIKYNGLYQLLNSSRYVGIQHDPTRSFSDRYKPWYITLIENIEQACTFMQPTHKNFVYRIGPPGGEMYIRMYPSYSGQDMYVVIGRDFSTNAEYIDIDFEIQYLLSENDKRLSAAFWIRMQELRDVEKKIRDNESWYEYMARSWSQFNLRPQALEPSYSDGPALESEYWE